MRQLDALEATVRLAERRRYTGSSRDTSIGHLRTMLSRATEGVAAGTFSDAKLGRWLGWVQGVLCEAKVITLNEAKEINKECADDYS